MILHGRHLKQGKNLFLFPLLLLLQCKLRVVGLYAIHIIQPIISLQCPDTESTELKALMSG